MLIALEDRHKLTAANPNSYASINVYNNKSLIDGDGDSYFPEWLAQEIDLIPEPPPTDWIVEGYIGKGLITELAGIWKAGKTTLTARNA